MTALQSKIGFKTCSSVHATQQAFAAILAEPLGLLLQSQLRLTDLLLHGAINSGVAIVLSKISSEMCNSFMPHCMHLLRSPMDQLLHGARQIMVATAPRCKISSRMCSRFMAQLMHLRQSDGSVLVWGEPGSGGDISSALTGDRE